MTNSPQNKQAFKSQGTNRETNCAGIKKKMAKITIFRNLNQMRQKYDKQTCKTQATN